MRIVSGEARGRKLTAPKSHQVRPTSDRVREAIFNTLGSMSVEFQGACVADLFAGTGALGLEAISRGAKQATFMDNFPQALTALKGNIGSLGWQERCRVYPLDVMSEQAHNIFATQHFDVIFCDPPYIFADWEELLGKLRCDLLVAESSDQPVAQSSKESVAKSAIATAISKANWQIRKIKHFRTTVITIIEPFARQ